MDPLSVAASVITIITLADHIMSICKGYVTTVKEASSDLRKILIEIGSVKLIVETLQLTLMCDGGEGHRLSKQLGSSDGPLESCRNALKALEQLLPSTTERHSNGSRRKLNWTYAELAWPLKESKARKLIEEIGRHKTTISVMLTSDLSYARPLSFWKLHGFRC